MTIPTGIYNLISGLACAGFVALMIGVFNFVAA